MTHVVDGEALAEPIRAELRGAVETLVDAGVRPGLGTVLVSDDPADERFVELKGTACADLGVQWEDRRVDPSTPAAALHDAIADLNADPGVHGVFVQLPVPDHVEVPAVRSRIDPAKDVDCLHPENLGRLVKGDPRFVPATVDGIQRLLGSAGVETDGAEVAVIGRSEAIGKPLANRLWSRAAGGNATVTVCHSRTGDLESHTLAADVVVSAAGVPGLVDGSMLSPGVAVVDVGGSRVGDGDEDGWGDRVVGDVDFDSAKEMASVITPVPGGVGPMTVAMLLRNVVQAASEQRGIQVDLP